MSNALKEQMKISRAALEKCLQRVLENFEGEERDTSVAKLRKLSEGYCLLEETAAITTSSILEAKLELEEQENKGMTFQQIYDSKFQEKERNLGDMKNHPKYIAFDKKVNEILAQANNEGGAADSGDDDDELRVTEAEVNTIDPISQQTMVSPVKNKICGHSYEKTAILQILRTKKKMRCPYVGCPSSRFFGPGDLEDDEALKEILMQRQAR